MHLFCNLNLKILDFFDFFVFFKVYFGHVPDCILAWKFFTIFFDPCRILFINKKIFEPIGRYWMCQTLQMQMIFLGLRPGGWAKNWVLWSVGLTSSLTSNVQIVCSLQYRPMGSKILLFILHGSKKIVKNFRPKYSLEHGQNTLWKIRKIRKKSKILRFVTGRS